ncbi:MAG: GTP cyclohydrolase MptA [Euryarchaeota archaeon ADurb.Bin009]|jgi:GTP cyclohydrolase IV|uniref:GTP cyclohydrolase MptA n=3 Tax=Methanoculleus sp. TaxID=90427 RepID=UPI0009C43C71|nr:GTP cyclohydrolase MptA [Methanoculleus sp.]OQC71867.1 MAG: GTP cyclohydrolase MptA [Euryarchaeota archaeon ADurb.Bin009]MBP7145551.1 GTP cyclohydrolase I FolE2 [Methanoculleus sp.]HNQ33497.1 GTP cyclohydrolase MptA [Methanoculleus sp.]HOC84495.1 GTP cyclohydrolase MptA [Methanoculleus sp.]HOF96776.1 GTP cyclohydrolase MptA [Methanoculleus sp.]
MELPDVQSSLPEVRINLTRVGVKNVQKLVEVARPGKRPVIFISNFDVFVDLPGSLKGANLSRNFEVIDDVLQQAIDGEVKVIEELCSAVARKLLDRHEYAERTEVRMQSQFMVRRETPISETSCHEVVNVHASAIAQRNDGSPIIRKSIGAEVTGMTACPCAQNIMKDHALHVLENLGVADDTINAFFEEVPMATHNQRGRGFLCIETDDDQHVSLEKIIKILKDSMSARIYELLKRGDESYVVMEAHKNPRFVEDCVREMARKVITQFRDLPGDSVVTIKQTNEESIHQHNAYAERKATIAELVGEMDEGAL